MERDVKGQSYKAFCKVLLKRYASFNGLIMCVSVCYHLNLRTSFAIQKSFKWIEQDVKGSELQGF